jgi:hypothetical protein
MNRVDVINTLIDKYGYKKYLEIGIRGGVTFAKVKCDYKVGVDPVGNPTYKMISDEFFKQNTEKFDIIFIDGLHTEEQVIKDVYNSLKFLNELGTIVMHDCNPEKEYLQFDLDDPRKQKAWCGTTWKAWVYVKTTATNLKMFVIDSDFGLGIIQKTDFNTNFPVISYTGYLWDDLKNNRKELLNLISVDEWTKELL